MSLGIGECREFFLCIFLVLITSFCREYDHLFMTLNSQFNVIKPSISDVSNSQWWTKIWWLNDVKM